MNPITITSIRDAPEDHVEIPTSNQPALTHAVRRMAQCPNMPSAKSSPTTLRAPRCATIIE